MILPITSNFSTDADDRFPDGRWIGFFLQPELYAGRCWMDISLNFSDGNIEGEGRDRISDFLIRGDYDLDDGEVSFQKYYEGYDVFYKGRHNGKAISGIWHLPQSRGPFVIWHESVADPTIRRMRAEAEGPVEEVVLISSSSFLPSET